MKFLKHKITAITYTILSFCGLTTESKNKHLNSKSNFLTKTLGSSPRVTSGDRNGFSLVEMIVYTSVFSMIMAIIVQFSIQVQFSGSKVRLASEIKENASQAIQFVTTTVREGESLNVGNSIFSQHPGRLVIDDTDLITLDTYTKNVVVGGEPVVIRKLRFTQGANSPLNITSDHVNVTNYQIRNLSHGGQPGVVQIFLELSSINPSGDPDFDESISLRTSVVIRKEN